MPKNHAFLIGVNEYDFLGQLSFARRDAEETAKALTDLFGGDSSDIRLMTCQTKGGTRAQVRYIKELLGELSRIPKTDTLIFGFWGHGVSFGDGEIYLCGTDTREDDIADSALPLSFVRDCLAAVEAQETFLILDCCQARSIGRAGETNTIPNLEQEIGRAARLISPFVPETTSSIVRTTAVLTSCKEGECAFEWNEREHGIFTAHLLDGLRRGITTSSALANYVSERVPETAFALYRRAQTPWYHAEGRGDIQLGTGDPADIAATAERKAQEAAFAEQVSHLRKKLFFHRKETALSIEAARELVPGLFGGEGSSGIEEDPKAVLLRAKGLGLLDGFEMDGDALYLADPSVAAAYPEIQHINKRIGSGVVTMSATHQDQALALQVRETLGRFGFDVVRVDAAWPETPFDHSAHIFCLGTGGIANWPNAVVRAVRDKKDKAGMEFGVLSVVAPEFTDFSLLPGFVRQFDYVRDLTSLTAFHKLVSTCVEGSVPTQEDMPFFGLSAIGTEDSHLFLGRERETAEVASRLAEYGIVLVDGDSGSGKSSLLQAGLIELWRGGEVPRGADASDGPITWHVVNIRPQTNPRRALGEAIEAACKALGRSQADTVTLAKLATEGSPEDVRRALRCGLDKATTRTLLVVDQLEELVHPAVPTDVRSGFSELLAQLADPNEPSVSLALGVRSDYANLLRTSECQALYERLEVDERAPRYKLKRISEAGLRKSLTRPLELAARDAEEASAMADLVIRDIGDRPGDLALAQFAMTAAWQQRQSYNDDLVKSYIGVGRVEGALATVAEQIVFDRLGGDKNAETVRASLVRLGSLSGSGVVRRKAHRTEFSDEGWSIMQSLASSEGNRLVLIGGTPPDETVEIAHEALLTQWERLHTWITEAPDHQRAMEALAARVNATQDQPAEQGTSALGGRLLGQRGASEPAVLLSDAEYNRFSEMQRAPGVLLSDLEAAVLAENAEFRAARSRRKRWGGWGLAAASVFFAALSLGLIYAFSLSSSSELEAKRNYAAVLTGLARDALANGNVEGAGKLVTASVEMGAPLAGANSEILEFVIENLAWKASDRAPILDIQAHDEELRVAAFSPDGKRFATASADDTVKVWDATTGDMIWHLIGHTGGVSHVVFSKDGRRLLSASFDFSVRIWDLDSGETLQIFAGHEAQVRTALYSADERLIVTASNDGSARLWEVESGNELQRYVGHADAVRSTELSPDGSRVMTSSADGTVRVWNASSGEFLGEIPGVEGVRLWMARYTPDGSAIAAASDGGPVHFYDSETLAPLFSLNGHQRAVYSIAFSPDGERMLSASRDKSAVYWNLPFREELQRLEGHTDSVRGSDVSALTGTLLTGGADGRAMIWPIVEAEENIDLRSEFCRRIDDKGVTSLEKHYGITIDPICE